MPSLVGMGVFLAPRCLREVARWNSTPVGGGKSKQHASRHVDSKHGTAALQSGGAMRGRQGTCQRGRRGERSRWFHGEPRERGRWKAPLHLNSQSAWCQLATSGVGTYSYTFQKTELPLSPRSTQYRPSKYAAGPMNESVSLMNISGKPIVSPQRIVASILLNLPRV